jgi:hypothetical protein
MASRKPARLEASLLAVQGEAAPAPMSTVAPTSDDDRIALTVKLPLDTYLALKARGVRRRPRKSNQQMILEAIEAYLAQNEGAQA